MPKIPLVVQSRFHTSPATDAGTHWSALWKWSPTPHPEQTPADCCHCHQHFFQLHPLLFPHLGITTSLLHSTTAYVFMPPTKFFLFQRGILSSTWCHLIFCAELASSRPTFKAGIWSMKTPQYAFSNIFIDSVSTLAFADYSVTHMLHGSRDLNLWTFTQIALIINTILIKTTRKTLYMFNDAAFSHRCC